MHGVWLILGHWIWNVIFVVFALTACKPGAIVVIIPIGFGYFCFKSMMVVLVILLFI
jgi:hypothetical protein